MTPLVLRLLNAANLADQCGNPQLAKLLTEAIKEIEDGQKRQAERSAEDVAGSWLEKLKGRSL